MERAAPVGAADVAEPANMIHPFERRGTACAPDCCTQCDVQICSRTRKIPPASSHASAIMAAMQLRHARMTDPLVAPLLAGLEAEYFQRYGENVEMSRAEAHQFDPPAGTFVVLLDGDITAAGGGYRPHADGVCEVKRMWTHPDYRRRGLAERVLTALEDSATAAGYTRLILETGPRQPEAVALYERRGYVPIPYYGHYPEALAFATDLTGGGRDENGNGSSSTEA